MRQVTYYPIEGGEDLLTPAMSVNPGRLLFSKNYELDAQGRVRRIDGFERTDGHPAPSAASYGVLEFTAGDFELADGGLVVGQTSGATGTVYLSVLSSGSWAGGDAAGYAVIFNQSATPFMAGETISISSANPGFSVGFSGGFS